MEGRGPHLSSLMHHPVMLEWRSQDADAVDISRQALAHLEIVRLRLLLSPLKSLLHTYQDFP
jgi:hypothetical protein